MSNRVGINGDRIGGGVDPLDRESHFVMPGTHATLCAEPITDAWEDVAAATTDPAAGEDHANAFPVDPLSGASVTDVLAFAVDPDVETRLWAAASRWNCDPRVQRLLAADPDEGVVLALLDNVDPGEEAARLIIEGPHVAARRVLAASNLPTELLELLAADVDPVASETARRTLAGRRIARLAIAR